MRVLGVSTAEDSGAAIVVDGVIRAAVNEERFCRIKQVKGFPAASIDVVLRLSGLSGAELDGVAVGGRNGFLPDGLAPQPEWMDWERSAGLGARAKEWAGKLSRFRTRLPFLESVYYLLQEPSYRRRRSSIRDEVRRRLGVELPVRFVDHHFAHAASAYYTSGLDEALVISLDGGGDRRSGLVCAGRGGELSELHGVPAYHSLGNWYSYVTHLCGLRPHRHEGKITGLAAHGEPVYLELLSKLIGQEGGTFRNRSGLVFREALRTLEERLPTGWERKDLAASIQVLFEREIRDFVRHWVRSTGLTRLALAGGVFANVRVNQELLSLPEVESVYVFPAMSDAGLAGGAALAACAGRGVEHRMTRSVEALPHVYLGPEVDGHGQDLGGLVVVSESVEGDLTEAIAARLAAGRVVAVARGALEYGPRALGNRSILYQPTDPSVMEWLNAKLDRTDYMPFAPAVLWESRHRCFQVVDGAEHAGQFMTIALDATPWMRQRMPGVVHVDGTARPQFVRRETNPFFHRVLSAYERRTGLPVLLNTSFNRHGEPIVGSAADAIRSFVESELDFLCLGDRLLRHPRVHEWSPESAAV